MKTITEMTVELLKEHSQPELAELAGTNQAQISRISKGQIPNYDLGKALERIYLDQFKESA